MSKSVGIHTTSYVFNFLFVLMPNVLLVPFQNVIMLLLTVVTLSHNRPRKLSLSNSLKSCVR